MTLEETAHLMKYLAATWPQFEVTEERMLVYQEHFEKFSVAQIKDAVMKFARYSEHTFPPSIPELYALLQTHPEHRPAALPEPGHTLTKEERLNVVESQREKLKKLYEEPKPKEIEDDEIVAGCDDQRFVYKSEVIP